MKIRGNSDYNRRQRQSNPYESSRPDRHNSYSDRASMALSTPRSRTEETTLKFLLTPLFAGVLIGTGGELIRELMKITGASVHVSNSTDYYPGTQLRTVYINGNEASVNLAQSLIWEMIGQQTNAVRENNRSLSWHPAAAKASPGEYDDEEVEGWITIPASAGGLIVGKAGSNLRHLHERSGIQLTIDTKEDAEATNERVLTLKGTAAGCMNCTFLVLSQLAADSNDYHYTLNGTTYKGIARRTHPVMSLSANTINSQLFTTIYNSNNNNNNSNSSNNSLSVNRSSSRTVVEISSARGRSGSFDLHSTAVPSFDLSKCRSNSVKDYGLLVTLLMICTYVVDVAWSLNKF